MIRYTNNGTDIFTAKAAASTGTTINVASYRHITLAVSTTSSANMTFKIQGSISDTAPNFSTSSSGTNHWDYVELKELSSGESILGSVGVPLTGTDVVKLYEVNTNGLKWLTSTITSYTAGALTIRAVLFTD